MHRNETQMLHKVLDQRSLRPCLKQESICVLCASGGGEGAQSWDSSTLSVEAVKSELNKLFRKCTGIQSIKVLPLSRAPTQWNGMAFVNFHKAEDGELSRLPLQTLLRALLHLYAR